MVGPYLKDERGWQLSQAELKKALGLNPNRKMPADFTMPPTAIGDTIVYIIASHGTRGHRVRAICGDCGKHVPAGRLHQHRKVHSKQSVLSQEQA